VRVIRFWKPFNVLTQFTDRSEPPRRTLADYIRIPDIYAAGRLDYDSEGLLILTDSGALNARLTQPKFAHPRTYWVQVERVPDEAALRQLREGVLLNDGRTLPTRVELLPAPPELPERDPPVRFRKNVPTAWLSLTLTEGRNRQVRRMTAAVGYPTLRLVRWAVGTITLDGLREGEWRDLTPAEIQALQNSAFRRKD
jgi:23S rRNA pseudouridine2457 synthase